MKKVYDLIKKISNAFTYLSGWIVLVLILVICFDVSMRYLFNKPTIWAYDVSYMLGGLLVVFTFATSLLEEGNTRVDVFYAKYSPKVKLIVDVVLNVFIYFPAYLFLTNEWIKNTYKSFITNEVITQTIWHPLFWPVKGLFTIGYIIFMLAYFIHLITDILNLISIIKSEKEGADL
jgi:TRAP-type mannitol/chloroaromatic compound transport system permease small subunit